MIQQICSFDPNLYCMGRKCGLWCEPYDAHNDGVGEGRCAFAMIVQQLNDLSNTAMGAERL